MSDSGSSSKTIAGLRHGVSARGLCVDMILVGRRVLKGMMILNGMMIFCVQDKLRRKMLNKAFRKFKRTMDL